MATLTSILLWGSPSSPSEAGITGINGLPCPPHTYTGSGDPDSSPLAFVASALTTESPSPFLHLLKLTLFGTGPTKFA